jgi:cytochrome c biogenesis protein CcmG, thiol:disulfide interchange protein DsbE
MSDASAKKPRNWLAFLPLALFIGLAGIFLIRLYAGDPTKLPSTLIGKPVPTFALPPVAGLMRDGAAIPGFSSADLAPGTLPMGKLALVNVFASWCAPCREEHPLLMELAKDPRLVIYGLNQKDRAENAIRFLNALGNPYRAVGADTDGRASIEWGVYGVPETFLVGRDGTILFKHVGPLTEKSIREVLEPAIVAGLK